MARKVYECVGDDRGGRQYHFTLALRLMNWGIVAGLRQVALFLPVRRDGDCVSLTSGGPRSELSRLYTSAGWRRELVRRGCGDTADRVDCYYFTPEGRKLRSLVQIQSVRECSHHQHIG